MAKQSSRNKAGKKLLAAALDEFYVFESDEIEDELDKAILKFQGQARWRKRVRAYLWGKPKIKEAICSLGNYIYNGVKQ